MIKKLLLSITILFVISIASFAQPLNITVNPTIGKPSQCPNSVPVVTCNFISGTGSSVVNGELVCSNPCDTTILQIEINNLKWNQGPDINWIHGVVFGGSSTSFTFLSSDLAPANWFLGPGCTGACPTGGQIAGGLGWYFMGVGQSCCPGGSSTANPCDNWGDGSFSCNGAIFHVKYTVSVCNSAIKGTPLYTDLYLYSDGNTGCWSQPDNFANIMSFTIPTVGCPTLYSPLPTASPRVKTCTPTLNYTTTLTGGCGNSNTITWWTASTGGTQVGTGSPFVYDPPGSACPQGTLYASCCPLASGKCSSRKAFAVPGACAAALSIDNVAITNPACPSQCGNITATTVSGASGTVTYTLMPDNLTNTTGVFTCITGANHTLTASDASGCQASYNVIFTIPVCGFPVTAPISYCLNATAVPLTATASGGGTNLQWYTALTGGTALATAPTPSTAVAGNTTYYVTQTNGGIESTPRTPLLVTVLALPVAPVVTTPVTYCQNATATALTATGTNLLWYANASGGFGLGTAPTPITTTAGSTTYYVSQSSGGTPSCESPRAAIVVNITATPAAPTVAPVAYCQNTLGVTPLTAAGTNLLWYTTATGGVGSSTSPTPSTTTVGTTTYYVSQTVSGCESPRSAIIVTINLLPNAPTVTTPVLYCQNDVAIALTAGGTNLLWYTAASGGIGSTTAPTPITTAIGNTTYYVSQSVGTCESPRSAITVTITVPPAVPIIVSPIGYCQNAPALPLTATGSNLLWYANASGGVGSATAPTPGTATAGSTTYYVSQTSGTCESPRAAIVVNITATPTAPVVAPISYCQGATGAIALFASGTNLLWYTSASGGTGNSSAPIPSTTTTGNTTYYASQTVSGCESPRSALVVTINPTPATPVVVSPLLYCQNDVAIPLIATGTNLLWYTTATAGIGSPTAPTPITTMVGSTTYYVSSTTGTCEGIRTPLIVTITNPPSAPGVTSPLIYCQGFAAPGLTAIGSNLLWYTTATGGVGTSVAPVPNTSTVGSTTYYVSQTSGSCESSRSAIVVTVNTTPTAPTTSPLTYCQNTTGVPPLTASGTNLLWYTTATGGIGSATAPTPITTTVGTITYYVSSTIGICESPRTALAVTINTTPLAPIVTAAGSIQYCQFGNATALTATGTNLLWYTTATGGVGSATAPIPNTAVIGTTTYYVSSTVGICEGPRSLITVVINPEPLAPTVITPETYCQGVTASPLNATGALLLWYTTATGGVGSPIVPTPSTTTVGTTNYYVSQTVGGGCVSPRANIVVVVNPTPIAPIVSTPVIYCQGATAIPLFASGSNLLWYSTATGGIGNSTTPTPSTTTVGNTVYYVSQSNAFCESPRAAITVTINPTPLAPIVSTPVVYCQNESALALTATGTSLLWYTTATGGIGSSTAPIPSTNTVGSTNYYVSQSIGICEGPRALIVVTIKPTTTASIAISKCSNTLPFNWNGQSLNTSGTYTNTQTGSNGCDSTTTLTFTVKPAPTATVIASRCANNLPYTWNGQTINTTGTYSNTQPAANGCDSVTTLNFTVKPVATKTVTVSQCSNNLPYNWNGQTINTTGTYTNTQTGANGCDSVTTLNFTVKPIKTAAVAISKCNNQVPFVWNGQSLNTSGTYTNTQTGSNGCDSTTTLTFTVKPTTTAAVAISKCSNTLPLVWNGQSLTTSGTYTNTQTGSNGCDSTTTLTFTVNPTPIQPIVSNLNYCQNTTATALTAIGTNLLWYTAATGGVGSASAPIPSTLLAGTTTYYVSQSTLACEGPRAAIAVTVTAKPTAPSVISPVTYCPNDVATPLNATGTNLLWYNIPVGGIGSAITPTPSTALPATITYYVSQSTQVNNILSCEGSRAAIIVNVNNSSLSVNIGKDTTICELDSVTFNPTVTPPASVYQWRAIGVPNSTITGISQRVATMNPVNNAVYILRAANGGCASEDTVNVFVRWKPILDVEPNKSICKDTKTVLSGLLSHFLSTKIKFAWTPIDSLATPTLPITAANPTLSTWYKLTATTTKADYGCDFTVSDSMKLVIQPAVKAFAGKDTIAVKGVPHLLLGNGGINYTWSTISSGATITNPYSQNAYAILQNDANFYLKVTDAVGCAGYDTVFVKAYIGPAYYVPNSFTPNGDGLNDIFRPIPVGIAYTTFFRVYNRYGELLFETNEWLKGWDGTFKNKPQPNGTYTWIIQGKDKYNNKIDEKGTVNLIR